MLVLGRRKLGSEFKTPTGRTLGDDAGCGVGKDIVVDFAESRVLTNCCQRHLTGMEFERSSAAAAGGGG